MHFESSEVNINSLSAPGLSVPEHHFKLAFHSSFSEIQEIYQDLPETTATQVEFKNMIGSFIGATRIDRVRSVPIEISMSIKQTKNSSCKKETLIINSSIRNIVVTGG